MFTDLVYAAVLYGTPAAARRIPVTTGLVTVAGHIGFLAWLASAGGAAHRRRHRPRVVRARPPPVSLVRNHRDAAEAARLRAEQTALLAEMDRTQAVTAERARMARELHDMVANHLSAIAIHSTAALSLDDPTTSQQALGVIRENSVEGLAEMRRLIGILRDGSGDSGAGRRAHPRRARTRWSSRPAPTASTCDLPTAPHDGARPRRSSWPRTASCRSRLTNALKHASAGPVTVRLAQRDHSLTCG